MSRALVDLWSPDAASGAGSKMANMKGLAFYSTVAQIIPILVIVAVVELRVFDAWHVLRGSWRWKRWGVPAIFIAAGVAEWRALLVLQNEHVHHADPMIVWSALLVLAGFMAGIVSEAAGRSRPPEGPLDRREGSRLL